MLTSMLNSSPAIVHHAISERIGGGGDASFPRHEAGGGLVIPDKLMDPEITVFTVQPRVIRKFNSVTSASHGNNNK